MDIAIILLSLHWWLRDVMSIHRISSLLMPILFILLHANSPLREVDFPQFLRMKRTYVVTLMYCPGEVCYVIFLACVHYKAFHYLGTCDDKVSLNKVELDHLINESLE